MPSFDLAIDIPSDRTSVFAALTDARRMQQWLYGTEEIRDISGPLSQAGTIFVQHVAKGIHRPGGIVTSDPPRRWHVRLAGMGERADLVFRLDEIQSGTRLTLTAEIRTGPALIAPIVDRLTWRIDRSIWRRALEHIREQVLTDSVAPVVGAVYVLEGGGRRRIGQVLDADDRHVHVELRPGSLGTTPASLDDIELKPRRLRDYLDLRPWEPTIRSTGRLMQRGSDALLADGGFGLAHAPMTIGAFRSAAPRLLGSTTLTAGAETRIETWRKRGGSAFGDQRPPRVGAFFSVALQAMGLDAMGFGVVKLLHQQLRGVHIRVYANIFVERPSEVDEGALESEPVDPRRSSEAPPTKPISIGHLPLGHGSFRGWRPEFLATSLVEPDELLGYEEWKLAKGGFF